MAPISKADLLTAIQETGSRGGARLTEAGREVLSLYLETANLAAKQFGPYLARTTA